MNIIPGKQIAADILENLKKETQRHEEKFKIGIVQVGLDAATEIYVSKKIDDARSIGIQTELFVFEESTYEQIKTLILELNRRLDITGYIIQLPLAIDGDLKQLLSYIFPQKDIDGMNAENLGLLWQDSSKPYFVPATVLGILKCLSYTAKNIDPESSNLTETDLLGQFLQGKEVLIINESIIVGRPLAAVMLNHKATVSICHKHTLGLETFLKRADIIISATGVPHLINSSQVKKDAILIDVGIARTSQGVVGDFDFESFSNTDCWITPVPNGVGPLTRAMLLENVCRASAMFSGEKKNSV
jgi:methylenetetrahydrofolate dehydrogenase (NADP+) / methenyltetrahydrofolate cyclohydrolase